MDKHGFQIWEAAAAAKQLIKMGVASKDVLEEAFSLDTIGNVIEKIQIMLSICMHTYIQYLINTYVHTYVHTYIQYLINK